MGKNFCNISQTVNALIGLGLLVIAYLTLHDFNARASTANVVNVHECLGEYWDTAS